MGKEAEDIAPGRSSSGGRADTPHDALDSEQYRFLLACCEAADVDRWNRWRRADLARQIRLAGAYLAEHALDGADLSGARLSGADLSGARLAGADLSEARLDGACLAGARLTDAVLWMARLDGAHLLGARLDGANLRGARLDGAVLVSACLAGADLSGADLRGADLSFAIVDGATMLKRCTVDRRTDFSAVGLASARVEPGLRQLLTCNMRRQQWARYCRRGPWPLRAIRAALCRPFWWLSDYGLSTRRIVVSFFVLAVAFATVLGAWPQWVTVDGASPEGIGFLHAVHLTVATMTSLGLGDVGLRPAGVAGRVLLIAEMLVGYVMLAALVVRFAVMFTAHGPADSYAPDPNAPWRRALRRLLSDPRRSRARPVRKLARALCEPNRIGRRAMACLLRTRRRLAAMEAGVA